MGRKNVSVTEAAHDALAERKRADESWTELFHRLAETEHEPHTVSPEDVAAAVAERLDIPDTADIATETSTRTLNELRTELR